VEGDFDGRRSSGWEVIESRIDWITATRRTVEYVSWLKHLVEMADPLLPVSRDTVGMLVTVVSSAGVQMAIASALVELVRETLGATLPLSQAMSLVSIFVSVLARQANTPTLQVSGTESPPR
jgi:hypothetical protein